MGKFCVRTVISEPTGKPAKIFRQIPPQTWQTVGSLTDRFCQQQVARDSGRFIGLTHPDEQRRSASWMAVTPGQSSSQTSIGYMNSLNKCLFVRRPPQLNNVMRARMPKSGWWCGGSSPVTTSGRRLGNSTFKPANAPARTPGNYAPTTVRRNRHVGRYRLTPSSSKLSRLHEA